MKINPIIEQVSKSKKIITAFVVVAVLLISAFVINSSQHSARLEAQASSGTSNFLVRAVANILPSRLDPMKRIPDNVPQFSAESADDGNVLSYLDNGQMIINVDNLDAIETLAIKPDETGVATIPENPSTNSLDSYIVTFKADPIVTKTKDILESKGKEILPGEKNKEALKQEIQKVKPQIDSQKNLITSQQNALISRVTSEFGSAKSSTSSLKTFEHEGKEIAVRQMKSSINAVTITNVTEEQIEELTAGVSNIEKIEKARTVKIDLLETPDVINTSSLQEFLGANGVPLTGQGTIIGIVDTGVDYTHQDLGACSFLLEGGCKVAYGYDFVNNDSDPMDDQGHGTHVAATAAGNGYYTEPNGNTQPLPGIAPDATIYAFKVLSAAGSGTNLTVIAGIEACVDPNGDGDFSDRVTVCSLSLGSANGSPLDSDALAADAAVDAGVIMTIAAGNDGPGFETVGSPGTSRKAITVGAACKPSQIGSNPACSQSVASFSSRGPVSFIDENNQEQILNKPDIVSPGVAICAAQWGDWMQGKACLGDNEHIAINGTSMATPTVAGLMALLAQAHPDKTVAELKETLMATATDLDLPVEVQGQGMVNGITALEGLGIPNSMIAIQGLPFYVNDQETSAISTFSKELVFENISEENLNITATRITNNPGVSLSFPQTISIPVGQDYDFDVSMTVNHAEAISGTVKETIQLSNGTQSVNLTITRFTPQYLETEFNKLNFGLFHQSQTSFSATLPLGLTNRMLEQSTTYDIQVDESLISNSSQDNITVTPSVNQITLGPGQENSINLTLSATSISGNTLPNKQYKVLLKFVSDTEVVPVELVFSRGYAFDLYYGDEAPDVIVVGSSSGWQMPYYPNPQEDSMTLNATQPGPYTVIGLYGHSAGGFDVITPIFQHDINLLNSTGLVTYDISKQNAEHRIENTYAGNSCSFKFVPESGDWTRGVGLTGGGKIALEYNTLPEDMHFSMICGNLNTVNDRIIFSQIYLTEGLNQDFSLNNDTAEISTRYIYGFDNREGGQTLAFGHNICNFRGFRKNGFVDSGYNSCSFWQNNSGQTLDLDEGETAVVEVRSLHTDTPETASVPSYPAFRIHAVSGTGQDSDLYMYTSAEMFATEDKLFAWNPASTGALTTTSSSSSFYEKYKVPVVNDTFITVGVSPLSDTSFVKAFQDDFGLIAGYSSSEMSPYMYADGSTESKMSGNPNPTKSRFSFLRNNQLVKTLLVDVDKMNPFAPAGSNIPDEEGDVSGSNYGGPAVGSYKVEIERVGKYNGEQQDGFFSSELEFDIATTSIDSVPPVIKLIQLVSGGVLQNHFDPQNPGILRLYVDAGNGIQNHNLSDDANGAYQISFMTDSISSVSAYAGDSFESMTTLPTPGLVDGYYSVDLSSLTNASGQYKYFKIELTDTLGNTTKYNFAIEVGQSLNAEEIADEFLLICVQNTPLVTFVPEVPIISNASGFVTVPIQVTNQDTQACAPRTFYYSMVTTLYPPFNSNAIGTPKVRVSTSPFVPPPNLQTTNSFFNTGTTNPGATKTMNIKLKPDATLASGLYQLGFRWVTGTGAPGTAVIQELPLTVNVGGVPEEPEEVCTTQNPSVVFNPITPAIDSGAAYIPFNVSVTNNDSSDCDPSNFLLNFDTDQYASFEGGTREIRGTGTVPQDSNFSTTEFSLGTGSVNPGQTVTKTGYLRTDMYFPNGTYQIGATISNSTLNTASQNIPFNVSVFGAETVPVCTANTTSVTFNPAQPTIDSGGPTSSFTFTITNNDTAPCAPSNFSLAFDTDQFPASISGTKKVRGSATSGSSFTTTEFTVVSGTLNPGQTYTGTGYLRTDMYFPNGTYQIGVILTDTTNNQTQTVSMNVIVNGAETEPAGGSCTRNPVSVTPIGLIASHPNTETLTKAYQLSITNNDTVGCPNTAFKVLITDPLEGFGLGKSNLVLPANNKFDHSWSLAPGQTQVKNVFYRNFGSIADQTVPLTIDVTDITQIGAGSTHVPITLQGSIKFGNPQ